MTDLELLERTEFSKLNESELLEFNKKRRKLIIKEKIKKPIYFIKNIIINIYYEFLEIYPKYSKIIFRSLIVINLLNIAAAVIFDKHSNIILKVSYIYLIFIVFHKIFYSLFGRWFLYEKDYKMTRKYITLRFPHIVKFFGCTGAGKDSTASAITKILCDEMPKQIQEKLKELKRILFFVDFNVLHEYINKNTVDYFNPNEEQRQQTFLKAIQPEWFIEYYNINLNEFLEDFKMWNQDIKGYKSEYIFDDNINPKHYARILYDYIITKARSYSVNYVLANQPFMENKNIMAKLFSYDFTRTFDDIVSKQGRKYEREVLWPWVEYCVVFETEVGLFYNNKNKISNSDIIADGVRNFKAANRHLVGEHTYFFSTDQVTNRENKSLRELIHAKCGIISRDIIQGGPKRIFFYKLIEKIRLLFGGSREKIDRKNEKIFYNKNVELKRLEALNKLNPNDELIEKQKNIIEKQYLKYKKKTNKINRFLSYNEARIERAKNDGYIYVQMSISDSEYQSTTSSVIPLRKLIDSRIPLFHSNYKIRLCFKTKDCYGSYDTHFLKTSSEYRSKKTCITWLDIPSWSPDFKMTKENCEYIGYESQFPMYGIDQQALFDLKYHLVDDKK